MRKGQSLIVKLLFEHLPLSLAIGIAGWWLSGDTACLLAALVAGWAIDADHLVDFFYYTCRTGKEADYSLVRTGKYFKLNGKVFVPLHAWEITLMLLFLALLVPATQAIMLCAAIAHGAHLLQDQLMYRVRPYGYWFMSRLHEHFAHDGFCAAINDVKAN
ncbi:MAG: hypothetical protein ACYC2R_08285 [Burkholderiales bacterium]